MGNNESGGEGANAFNMLLTLLLGEKLGVKYDGTKAENENTEMLICISAI